jgi:hypothetical protein
LAKATSTERNTGAERVYDPDDDVKIIAWRVECFQKLGIEALHANALAVRRDIDLVDVVRLIKAGAPRHQVGAILLW